MYPETDLVKLIPYTEHYVPVLWNWYNDKTYQDFFRQNTKLFTPQDFINYSQLVGGTVLLAFDKSSESESIVGLVNLVADSKKNNGFYLALLVDKKYQNNRLSNDVSIAAMDYAFNSLNYQKCIVEVLERNVGLNKTLEKTGFTLEGLLEKECFQNGEFLNEKRWVMFKDKFNEVNKKVLEDNKNVTIS